MKVSPRVYLPVGLAVTCVAVLLGYLWWELEMSAQKITGQILPALGINTEIDPSTVTAAPVDPRDQALLHLRQGDLLALRGDWADAEKEYARSVEAGGGLPALRKLAQAQLQRRNIDGVNATLRALRTAGARPEDLVLLESIVELRTGELVRAKTILEAAEESPQKHYGLGLLAVIEGRHQQAEAEFQQVIDGWEPVLRSYARTMQSAYDEFALFPESSNLHLITLLARAFAQVNECELALPLLVQVTQAQDDYRDAWVVQGYCELVTERYEQAVLSLERAYSLDPQKPEIQYFLARAYAARGEHGNAITFFEYALTNGFEPKSEIRRHIAEAALLNNQPDLAIAQYEQLTQGQDATMEGYEGYVTAAIALDRKEEAYVKAKEATERFPDDALAHDLLGWAALETNRKDEARDETEKALDIDPFLASAKERMEAME